MHPCLLLRIQLVNCLPTALQVAPDAWPLDSVSTPILKSSLQAACILQRLRTIDLEQVEGLETVLSRRLPACPSGFSRLKLLRFHKRFLTIFW